jgi:hypothetical protein
MKIIFRRMGKEVTGGCIIGTPKKHYCRRIRKDEIDRAHRMPDYFC